MLLSLKEMRQSYLRKFPTPHHPHLLPPQRPLLPRFPLSILPLQPQTVLRFPFQSNLPSPFDLAARQLRYPLAHLMLPVSLALLARLCLFALPPQAHLHSLILPALTPARLFVLLPPQAPIQRPSLLRILLLFPRFPVLRLRLSLPRFRVLRLRLLLPRFPVLRLRSLLPRFRILHLRLLLPCFPVLHLQLLLQPHSLCYLHPLIRQTFVPSHPVLNFRLSAEFAQDLTCQRFSLPLVFPHFLEVSEQSAPFSFAKHPVPSQIFEPQQSPFE